MAARVALTGAATAFIVAAIWLGHEYYYNFNPDSLALLRLAHYWATGNWHLAVSSYWGPLFPLLMSPLLAIELTPYLAARLAMGLSGLLYLIAVHFLLVRLGLRGFLLGGVTTLFAVYAALYSALAPTADLLMSGLLCLGTVQLLDPAWAVSRRRQCAAGALLGLAYLAKAVALPLAILLVGSAAWWRAFASNSPLRSVAVPAAWTMVFVLAISLPWILTLSVKFDRPMFSSSGSINHAIAGPPDVDRYHPVGRTYHLPEPGREFAWEDPINMTYKYWSPLESTAYFKHQTRLLLKNALYIAKTLGYGFLVFAALAFWKMRPSRMPYRDEVWRWSLPAVLLLSSPYLPVFAGANRYYLACFPFLVAATVMLLLHLGGKQRPIVPAAVLTVTVLFAAYHHLWPAWMELRWLDGWYASAAREALSLSEAVRTEGLIADVASVDDDRRAGMFLAYNLGTRWRGNRIAPSLGEVMQSGAGLLVVRNSGVLLPELAAEQTMRELTPPISVYSTPESRRTLRYFFRSPN
jgi:hypothetical protein